MRKVNHKFKGNKVRVFLDAKTRLLCVPKTVKAKTEIVFIDWHYLQDHKL
jgi:hypothetical protein